MALENTRVAASAARWPVLRAWLRLCAHKVHSVLFASRAILHA